MAKTKTIDFLQWMGGALISGAQQHFIHAQINLQKGYTKLGNRMLEEYKEETENVTKIINRLLELGAVPQFKFEEIEIYPEVEDQLRYECKQQVESLVTLEKMITEADLDLVTDDYFIQYLKEETDHATWLKQQVGLIEAIGLQNYLAKQL